MKKLVLILFFSSIFTNIFAAGQLDTKNKGELNVYGCCEEAYLVAACQKFEKMYGIKTHYQRLSTVEALEKIADAHGTPSADIWFGGTTDPFNEAATKGLLLPYEARNACHLTEKLYKDPQNRWYGIYLGILGFYWNKTELRRLKLDPPKDWEDLINPKYQGLIAFGSPKTSGTGRMVVNTIVQHRGEESAMAYFKKLNKNVAFYTESGITPAKLLATGEVVIGIGFLHDALCQIVDYNYDNIGLTVPYSGTSYEIGPVAILAGCKNEENAKKFDIDSKKEFILLAPGAAFGAAKRWPPEYFAELTKLIAKKYPELQIVVTGGKNETYLAEQISKNSGVSVIDVAGKTNLMALGVLLSRAKVVIANDSGTMHLAALYRTPTIVPVGPTDMVRTGALNKNFTPVIATGCEKIPCRQRVCPLKTDACMKSLTPSLIFHFLKEQLGD